MKPFRFCAVPALLFALEAFAFPAAATETVLASSPEGDVSATQLGAWLDRIQDSDYATTAVDYSSTGGLEQAVADIVLERRLAALAGTAGLAENPDNAARIAALEREILLGLAQEALRAKISVSDREVEERYRSRLDQYTRPEQVDLHLYMIPTSDRDPRAARTRLEQLRAALAATESPEETAGFDDVTSGAVVAKAGDFPPDVAKRIFGGKKGGLTDVFGRKNAWYLARIVDHRTTQTAALEEVGPQLRHELVQSRLIAQQTGIENELETKMPLKLHRDALARLTEKDSAQRAKSETVLAEAAGTSITLADVSVHLSKSPDTIQQDEIEKAVPEMARRLRAVHWAKSRGYADSQEFRLQFEQQKNSLLAGAFLMTLETGTSPTEAELRAYYEKEKPQFAIPEQKTVTEVFLPLPRQDDLSSHTAAYNQSLVTRRRAMEAVRKRIASGATVPKALEALGDLKDEARAVDRGTAPEGPRGRVLDMAVQGVDAGQVSEVQQTRSGFWLFVVRDALKARDSRFEEVREDVLRAWEAMRRQDTRQRFVDTIAKEIAPAYDEKALQEFRKSRMASDAALEN